MTPADVARDFPSLTNAQCARIGTLLTLGRPTPERKS
jgi:hypothetical protein